MVTNLATPDGQMLCNHGNCLFAGEDAGSVGAPRGNPVPRAQPTAGGDVTPDGGGPEPVAGPLYRYVCTNLTKRIEIHWAPVTTSSLIHKNVLVIRVPLYQSESENKFFFDLCRSLM